MFRTRWQTSWNIKLTKGWQDIFVARAIKKGVAGGWQERSFYFSGVSSYIFQAEANIFRSWYTEQNIPWVVRCETQRSHQNINNLAVRESSFAQGASIPHFIPWQRIPSSDQDTMSDLEFINFTLSRHSMRKVHLTDFFFMYVNQITYGWKGRYKLTPSITALQLYKSIALFCISYIFYTRFLLFHIASILCVYTSINLFYMFIYIYTIFLTYWTHYIAP